MHSTGAKTIDGYIRHFPKSTQALLRKLRRTIKKAAPKAGEKISYEIPTFTFRGNLVHFAAYEHHIGFYPGAAAVQKFKKEISRHKYETSKGTIQFPLDKPLPLDLVTKIVRFRVKQNTKK